MELQTRKKNSPSGTAGNKYRRFWAADLVEPNCHGFHDVRLQISQHQRNKRFSPHHCVWFLFLVVRFRPLPFLHPPPAFSLTYLLPYLHTHTTYSHTTYSHTTYPHTTYSDTTYPHTTHSHTHTTYSHTTQLTHLYRKANRIHDLECIVRANQQQEKVPVKRVSSNAALHSEMD